MTSKYADGASVTVNLRSGQGIGSPTFPSGSEGTEEHTVTLLKTTDTEKVLDKSFVSTPLALDIPAYCRPIAVETNKIYNLSLTTTYDVYDMAGVNLGERTSVNKVQFNMAAVSPGLKIPLVLTVKPTYLYILSDNDLNNPIITVNGE